MFLIKDLLSDNDSAGILLPGLVALQASVKRFPLFKNPMFKPAQISVSRFKSEITSTPCTPCQNIVKSKFLYSKYTLKPYEKSGVGS